MSQLPYLTVIIIENLVLAVILLHVLLDHFVVDDGGADSLFVLLNLLLGLEGRLNLSLHRRTTNCSTLHLS